MEPTAALHSIETVLRTAIHRVFDGDDWLAATGAPRQDSLIEKQTTERSRRDGVVVSTDLLEYADTPHLTTMVLKSWEQFKPIFEDKKRTEAYFGIISDVRNAIAHSRSLVPFERDLLSGVAQHLSNLLSLSETSGDATRRYYPTIEEVGDSLGNVGSKTWSPGDGTVLRLEVGQKVRFQGRAVSARGRNIKWHMSCERVGEMYAEVWEIGTGAVLDYEWTVAESEVREFAEYAISIASDSKYHRHTSVVLSARVPLDDVRYFTYSVNPPAED
ncbi:SAV2148 family HEPN domain-containing protein [Georgenia sp. MJ170]|uniref:SAV2148 family HEPN domain-containing protein n=1 Tax=Georgenia sunbinii TaxID=3117728 RepID=UPI002F267565